MNRVYTSVLVALAGSHSNIVAAVAGVATSCLILIVFDLVSWRTALSRFLKKSAIVFPRDAAQPLVTLASGATLNPASLWTVHNKRYALDSFVASHPGGQSSILLGKGANCTELFESYHSLSDQSRVRKTLALYEIAGCPMAVPGDRDFDASGWEWQHTPFRDALVRRVKQYFVDLTVKEQKQTHQSSLGLSSKRGHKAKAAPLSASTYKATRGKVLHTAFFTALSAVCLVAMWGGSWLGMLCLPLAYWLGPSTLMHDGAHFSLSAKPTVNWCCSYLGSAHMSVSTWNQQHVLGHHCFTNLEGHDPDLYHFTFLCRSGLLGFRVSPGTRIERSHVLWKTGLVMRAVLTTAGPSLLWDGLSHAVASGRFLGLVEGPPCGWGPGRLLLHGLGRAAVLTCAVGVPLITAASLAVEKAAQRAFVSFSSSSAAGASATTATTTATGLLKTLSWSQLVWPVVCALTAFAAQVAKGLVFAFLPFAIHGVIFYAFSQVSHIQSTCFQKTPTSSTTPTTMTTVTATVAASSSFTALTTAPAAAAATTTAVGAAISSAVDDDDDDNDGNANKGDGKDAGEGATTESSKTLETTTSTTTTATMNKEWYAHQCASTMDWNGSSRLWLYLSNGLNHQITHHLFPQVDWSHHIELGPIVARTCAEFGVPYESAPTFTAALNLHLAHLKDLNDRPRGSWQKKSNNSGNNSDNNGSNGSSNHSIGSNYNNNNNDSSNNNGSNNKNGSNNNNNGSKNNKKISSSDSSQRSAGPALAGGNDKGGGRTQAAKLVRGAPPALDAATAPGLAFLGQLDEFHYKSMVLQ